MRKVKIIIALFCIACSVHAQNTKKLKLSPVLQSNMVVQQNQAFKVWGQAPAGANITIQADWMSTPVSITANAENKFIGIIPVPAVRPGDFSKHQITISGAGETQVLENVLVGETWICSGQSNMQFKLHETLDSARELPVASYPQIRLFSAGLNFSNEPLDSIQGTWQECTPATARTFSAVGYHFGRELFARLNVPIGLVFTGIGASSAQAYVPREALAADLILNSAYLQPYLDSPKSKEKMDGGFTFEKVTRPFLLYNAVINPFVNLSVKGFIWYQGESNRGERESYTRLTQTMIQSWRAAFAQGNLPFYYVQVAPFWYDKDDATLADYAFFREAQERVGSLGNTEMVVTMDVGESRDLHPKNKKPIGVRLAKTALNRTYGALNIGYQGPKFDFVLYGKKETEIHFLPETVRSGLETNNGKAPEHFFLAGEDQKFYPANASIDESRIVLTCPHVKNPVAVRYAFTNFPVTNLQNKDGLPALPFRSDDWPEPSAQKMTDPKPSMGDLAKKLNVSKTTISFILNGKAKEKRISESLVEKVLAEAENQGYRPNQFAQSLRTGRTNIIGLMVEDISNPFYASIAKLIEEKVYQNGYKIVYCSTENDVARGKDFLRMFSTLSVDGCIIAPTQGMEQEIRDMLDKGKSVVLFDRYFGNDGTDAVMVDNQGGMFQAVNHLVARGAKNIGLIALALDDPEKEDRIIGFKKAIADHGLATHVFPMPFKNAHEDYLEDIREILGQNKLDAVVFGTNYLGIAGLEVINQSGLSIPDDIAMVSFDDHDLFRIHRPGITVIAQPIEAIAQVAIDTLMSKLRNPALMKKAAEIITLPTSLIIRASS